MFKITVCLLTFNSERLLRDVIPPLLKIADEIVIVDSGSTDNTLHICQSYGLSPVYKKYGWHGEQMNHAVSLASHDWVLCIDSDEILDSDTVDAILKLKRSDEPDPAMAWRICRHWYVLGEKVRTLYPVSSPDFPVRLFNRKQARFNNRPVDDKVEGFRHSERIPGYVRHDTFHTLHELFSKLNGYTTRLVQYQTIRPSICRGVISAIGAFFKWYLFSGAWRQGRVGAATGLYATAYSFLKYFKAWYQYQERKEPVTKEQTDSHITE